MCGIWFFLSKKKHSISNTELYNLYSTVKSRGPESSTYYELDEYGLKFGFHRLKIMDKTTNGLIPF